MSAAPSHYSSSNSASASPPESPSLQTPGQLSPRLRPMAAISPAPLGHKSSNSIGLSFSGSDVPSTVDLSDDIPSRQTFSPHLHSPRPDEYAYTSSAQPTTQTQHRGHFPRVQTERGLISGTPPTPGSESSTSHERRDSPAYSDSPYTDAFPLSGANGVRAYATQDEAAGPTGFIGSTPYWLGMYFFFNLGLTLFNKVVLVSFPFAYVSRSDVDGADGSDSDWATRTVWLCWLLHRPRAGCICECGRVASLFSANTLDPCTVDPEGEPYSRRVLRAVHDQHCGQQHLIAAGDCASEFRASPEPLALLTGSSSIRLCALRRPCSPSSSRLFSCGRISAS